MANGRRRIARWVRSLAWQRLLPFGLCVLFIASISVHDAILIILNDDVIDEVEQNPLGRWLLRMQGGDVWLFVLVKLAGTAFVCAALITLYQIHRRVALAVSSALAAFQFILLVYLLLA